MHYMFENISGRAFECASYEHVQRLGFDSCATPPQRVFLFLQIVCKSLYYLTAVDNCIIVVTSISNDDAIQPNVREFIERHSKNVTSLRLIVYGVDLWRQHIVWLK